MKVDAAVRSEAELAAFYDHQDDAVAAIMRIYTPSPRARRPRFRAQLHMAPGLGKTWVAARIAGLVAARGSLLMVVPTRALLEQTYRVLRAAGRGGPVIAVYAPRDAALAGEPGVRVTTDPRVVAWHANTFAAQGGRFTVLATYASVENSLIAGHRLSVERDGARPLPEWDLLVCDESHHTETSQVWGRINEQHLVPAWHRLSMTATPRLLGAVHWDEQGRLRASDPVVRLSERKHGPVAYRLGLREAQRRGKLAHSPVVAAEVDEARLRELVAARGRADAGVRAELLTASLGAVLRAGGRVGCRRLLTYHSTVAGARAAAASLPQLARVLHGQGTSAPRRVWAVALHEGTPARERQRALAALAAGTDLRGRPVDLAVVCSVRLLSEGVDVPAVDAVALVDPRAAQGDLLQIAGRAVRYDWENPEKVASIIVPVLHLAQAADDTLVGPDWAPVINMLRALESYEPDHTDREDEEPEGPQEAVRRLERAGRSSSRGPHRVQPATEARERAEERARELQQMLTLTRQRSAAVVADWLKITVLSDPVTADTERLMRAVRAYHQRNGHLRVPVDWQETLPLDYTRIPLLKKPEHEVVESQEQKLSVRRELSEGLEHGYSPGLARRQGQELAEGPVPAQRQEQATRQPERREQDQGLAEARFQGQGLAEGQAQGRAQDQEPAVGPGGVVVRLGWELERARRQWRRDRDDLRGLVAELGPEEGLEAWRARPRRVPGDLAALLGEYQFVWEPRASARQLLVEAAREYADRYGHLLPGVEETISVDGQEVRIGRLLSECRRPSWGARDEEQDVARVLEKLGVWRVRNGAPWNAGWERKLVLLEAFYKEGGRRGELLTGERVFRGDDLGKWLCDQHRRWPQLRDEQRAVLLELRMGPATGDRRVKTAGAARVPRSRAERLMEIVTAARQHLEEIGPLVGEDGRHCVHDTYRPRVNGIEVQLRRRLNAVRSRFHTYPPEHQALFTGLDLPWATAAGGSGEQPSGPVQTQTPDETGAR
ncbi:DEAD/DEAH box helicase family protein [Streptomyces sp. NRRL B-1347]|uniref:DEAD/DEAH box helicase family protein n=1 Tax=Streptomyces sp. NRRL B-1347 TaxID=1476877 RepID=UPI0004C836DB|nr:DEAD/DEAH box helicase family protein [Streptomyces sp. NRRL B-1347]